MPTPKEAAAGPTGFRKWLPVFVLSLALAIILIDGSLLNVSLATLVQDLHTDIQSLQWVITAYALTIAALTITGGRLGDLFGRKKMFVIGAVTFAAGSLLASLSTSVPMLILGESIIEGIGAAMMMPATASLLVSTYKGRDRGLAFGIWGGVAAASTALGPLLGGYMTTYWSWRWGFRINVVVAAVLVLGSVLIKEYREHVEKPSLDVVGVLLSSLGLLSFVYGIIEASTYGWWTATKAFSVAGLTPALGGLSVTPVAMGMGMAVLALFLFWERHVERSGGTPLVSLHLFQNRQFLAGMTTSSIMSLGQAGLVFSVPVFLQAVRGASAFETGLAMVPMSITALVMAPLSGWLSNRIAPKRMVQAGFAAFTSGYAILYFTLAPTATAWDMLPAFVVMGFGMGLIMSSMNNLTLSAVSVEQAGEASGVNNTMRQVGGSLGTAVIGAVMLTAISANLLMGIDASRVIPATMKATVAVAVQGQASNVEFGGGARFPTSVPPAVAADITAISRRAITDANKQALAYAFFIGLVGLLSTLWLPSGTHIEAEEDLTAGHSPALPSGGH